ncbi:hypothetical protein PBI_CLOVERMINNIE_60 [Gordonia phage CloverMinnie]|nr:hypothetical protein PBI_CLOVERMINNIE_60 [Gordonia phage CloverMinnie]
MSPQPLRPLRTLTDRALCVMVGMALAQIADDSPKYRPGGLCQVLDEMRARDTYIATLTDLGPNMSEALMAREDDDRMAAALHRLGDAPEGSQQPRHLRVVR